MKQWSRVLSYQVSIMFNNIRTEYSVDRLKKYRSTMYKIPHRLFLKQYIRDRRYGISFRHNPYIVQDSQSRRSRQRYTALDSARHVIITIYRRTLSAYTLYYYVVYSEQRDARFKTPRPIPSSARGPAANHTLSRVRPRLLSHAHGAVQRDFMTWYAATRHYIVIAETGDNVVAVSSRPSTFRGPARIMARDTVACHALSQCRRVLTSNTHKTRVPRTHDERR